MDLLSVKQTLFVFLEVPVEVGREQLVIRDHDCTCRPFHSGRYPIQSSLWREKLRSRRHCSADGSARLIHAVHSCFCRLVERGSGAPRSRPEQRYCRTRSQVYPLEDTGHVAILHVEGATRAVDGAAAPAHWRHRAIHAEGGMGNNISESYLCCRY